MKNIINIDAFLSTVLVFVSMLIFPVIFSFSFFDPFEKVFSDFEVTDIGFNELREANSIKPDTNLVLININNLKISDLVFLLGKLENIKPKVIAVIKEFEKNEVNENLNEMLRNKLNSDEIVLGYYFNIREQNNSLLDIYITEDDLKAGRGFLNVFIYDSKEFYSVMEFYPTADLKGSAEQSFAISVVRKYDAKKAEFLLERDNEKERIFFRGNLEKFYWVHASDILKAPESYNPLQGKIVLLGEFSPDKTPYKIDTGYFTPLNKQNVGRTFPDMYPVVLQANIISMIINEHYYSSIPGWLAAIIAFILCYINMLIFGRINRNYKQWYEIHSVSLFLLESIFILFMTVLLFHEYNFELNLNLTIFAIALSIFVFEGYNESAKPLTIRAYNHIFKR